MERVLAQKRESLEALRDAKSAHDLQCSECRMRRQNMIDRVTAEYHLTLEQVWASRIPRPKANCPRWKRSKPPWRNCAPSGRHGTGQPGGHRGVQ